MASVLYLTQDGITDHIGQAQIAPYILGLARLGHSIHVVSAEKPGREQLTRKYRQMFEDLGVKWTTTRYSNRPPLISSAVVLWNMYRIARSIMAREKQQIIHCRAYLPLPVAAALKRRFRAKLLIDFRDFWADVGIETKPFKFVFRYLKQREPDYLRAADHMVTLTNRAADVLCSWYPAVVDGNRARYEVIPCCADFSHFDPARLKPQASAKLRRELGLSEDDFVLLYLGSLGHDYLLPQMLLLFRELLDLKPHAKFLFLTNAGHDAVEHARIAAGVPADVIRFASVDRSLVPDHVSLADLSVVFIRPTLSKAGCSPTKLAELFAMNVPVIANSGVGDIDSIVNLGLNGSVTVPDFESTTLRHALQQVLSLPHEVHARIRSNSHEFSLSRGIERYDRVYRLLSGIHELSTKDIQVCAGSGEL